MCTQMAWLYLRSYTEVKIFNSRMKNIICILTIDIVKLITVIGGETEGVSKSEKEDYK